MKRLSAFACLMLLLTSLSAAEPLVITAAEWAQPRNGRALMQHPALVKVMSGLGEGQRLQLVYPGGDEGSLWAAELKAWLVALGLSSQRIELLPGSPRADVIELRIVANTNGAN